MIKAMKICRNGQKKNICYNTQQNNNNNKQDIKHKTLPEHLTVLVFMAQQLCWIAFNRTYVANKMHKNTVCKCVIYNSCNVLEKLENVP